MDELNNHGINSDNDVGTGKPKSSAQEANNPNTAAGSEDNFQFHGRNNLPAGSYIPYHADGNNGSQVTAVSGQPKEITKPSKIKKIAMVCGSILIFLGVVGYLFGPKVMILTMNKYVNSPTKQPGLYLAPKEYKLSKDYIPTATYQISDNLIGLTVPWADLTDNKEHSGAESAMKSFTFANDHKIVLSQISADYSTLILDSFQDEKVKEAMVKQFGVEPFKSEYAIEKFILNLTPSDMKFSDSAAELALEYTLLATKSIVPGVEDPDLSAINSFDTGVVKGFQIENEGSSKSSWLEIFDEKDNYLYNIIVKAENQKEIDYILNSIVLLQ